MTDSSNSTEDRIVIEASLCGGKPVVVGFEGYSLEHIAEMIEAVTGCSLLGPHDPRLLREHRARRVAEIRAALRLPDVPISDIRLSDWLDREAHDATPTKPRRQHGPHKPTLADVAKLANKPGIARIERKPDGTVVIITGEGDQQQGNEVDEWIAKHARAPERH